ncbi:hypothetical protein HELRODRAFT_192948 [Helobdella robusta]|uniref:Uncharacterized protein n=1 Tax=Helobdella robusta TaxID=6412 RepID=T1FUG0_HELRO|nr:hypothetical protein HELRODRAFT_192948 [Helobdella robusta]ESN98478.1 hypothetical protein HELRODRAFT_192948 [Helobdella robusta]
MSTISNSRPNLSTSQGNLSSLPPSHMTLEKKAWFMCKILCRELNGFNFAMIRERLTQCKGIKTKVKLNRKGWRMGSKFDLNTKISAEFMPIDCIYQVLQDVQYVNVLFIILSIDKTQTEVDQDYEIWAYKLKNQSSAFRFQDIFARLTGIQATMPRSMSRSELSMAGMSMYQAKNYPMGPLAVDRWNGRQGPRSEASYGYYGRSGGRPMTGTSSYSVVPASSIQRSNMLRDDHASEMESFDSGGADNRTYREVAVSANFANGSNGGRPVLRSETSRVGNSQYSRHGGANSSVSETWCQADDGGVNANAWYQHEARALVTPNHFNGNPQNYTNIHETFSSVDDSGFYNGSEIAVAHVKGSGGQNSVDLVDGTVSVRKVFNKKNNPGTVGDSGDSYRYQQESTNLIGRRTRSTDYLGPGGQNVSYAYNGRVTPSQGRYLQVLPGGQQMMRSGGSRSDFFNDAASVTSQGSMYLLDPKFKKAYVRRDHAVVASGTGGLAGY